LCGRASLLPQVEGGRTISNCGGGAVGVVRGRSPALNSGVDPTEVAQRAGNSVEVLLSRYVKCIDGRQEIANRKIEELLRE
jgi:hypothetical protein